MKRALALLFVLLPACAGEINSKPENTGEVEKGLADPRGPDISVDAARLRQSIAVVSNATVTSAEVQEGCARDTTGRTLVRFDVKTPNFGPADLVFGHVTCKSTDTTPACSNVDCAVNPDCCCNGHSTCSASANSAVNAGFEFSCAHRHIHFTSFAQYRLLDSMGQVAATGHKQSFCLEDLQNAADDSFCRAPNPFTCGNQGIHVGCADVYDSALPCAFVDATGLAQGDYTLEVTMDPQDLINESNENNNVASAPVHLAVGPLPTPPPPAAPQLYLIRDGQGNAGEANGYLTSLRPPGRFVSGAYTIDQFRGDFITGPTVSALYRNQNELGFWRQMTCTQTVGRNSGGCFVVNWSDPTGPTTPGATPLGTVAMRLDEAGRTQFLVFTPDGKLSPAAILDDEGAKFVPRLCTTCHGGEYAGNGADPDLGSIFREFEPSKLQAAPGVAPLDAGAQWLALNTAIRGANQAVRSQAEGGPFGIDEAKASMESYLSEMYVNAAAIPVNDPAHVPASWKTDVDPRAKTVKATLWEKVVNPYCMTCHRSNRFSYNNYGTFSTLSALQDGLPLIRQYINVNPNDPNRTRLTFMPQAKLQWQNLANDAEAIQAIDAWLSLPTDQPPVANAGTNQTVAAGVTVSLSGQASTDPNNDTLTFQWVVVNGPAVTFSPSATARDVTFVAPGVAVSTDLQIQLTVKNTHLSASSAQVAVTVAPINNRLTATSADTPINIPDNNPAGITSAINIVQNQLITDMKVTFNITHTYIGDLIVELRGPQGFVKQLHNREGRNTHNLNQTVLVPEEVGVGRATAGVWQLFVSDNANVDVGTLDSWTLDFGVGALPANLPPVANAGLDQTVASGATVALSAAGSSDPDGDSLTFEWSQTGGPAVTFSPAAISRDVSFVAPAVTSNTAFAIHLRVTDSRGAVGDAALSVTVTPPGSSGRILVSSADTPINIPDNTAAGITSTLTLTQESVLSAMTVAVNITHTYIGDLVIDLHGPNGFVKRLRNREGGNTHDLHQSFDVPEAIGLRTNGAWSLFVADLAAADVGVLQSWSLDLQTGTVASPPPGTSVSATDVPIGIPDNDLTGITSSIAVAQTGNASSLSVTIDITHTYIGDLIVTLLGPNGVQKVLHNREGGNTHDLHATIPIPEAAGQPMNGTWQLHVQDAAAVDVGTLTGWSLQFTN